MSLSRFKTPDDSPFAHTRLSLSSLVWLSGALLPLCAPWSNLLNVSSVGKQTEHLEKSLWNTKCWPYSHPFLRKAASIGGFCMMSYWLHQMNSVERILLAWWWLNGPEVMPGAKMATDRLDPTHAALSRMTWFFHLWIVPHRVVKMDSNISRHRGVTNEISDWEVPGYTESMQLRLSQWAGCLKSVCPLWGKMISMMSYFSAGSSENDEREFFLAPLKRANRTLYHALLYLHHCSFHGPSHHHLVPRFFFFATDYFIFFDKYIKANNTVIHVPFSSCPRSNNYNCLRVMMLLYFSMYKYHNIYLCMCDIYDF